MTDCGNLYRKGGLAFLSKNKDFQGEVKNLPVKWDSTRSSCFAESLCIKAIGLNWPASIFEMCGTWLPLLPLDAPAVVFPVPADPGFPGFRLGQGLLLATPVGDMRPVARPTLISSIRSILVSPNDASIFLFQSNSSTKQSSFKSIGHSMLNNFTFA